MIAYDASTTADGMQRLRRWYAWFVRRAPRIRDLLYVGFSLLTIVAAGRVRRRRLAARRDWFVLGAGIVASRRAVVAPAVTR